MRKSILLGLLLGTVMLHAQNYQPSWESLDQRPVPAWFTDAKFGIFIHWGVYSVPAYTTKGSYAEWYQNGLVRNDSAKKAYHQAKFGNQTYYQLADQFKAELFNPDEWAKLFEQSGAKYIVLTSKHHDGFALWPSKEASKTWGFPWNAVDAGPHRDLLGDLFKAVRKTSVHPGMYYSLYEWYNPLWKSDPEKYVSEHMWPQMKELINTYQPDVFWTDGDWDAADDVWKSTEFIAWMYNQSPVKDRIVTYDRWGKGIRFHHGAVYTPEYQPDLDFEDHPWEESRGMGYSYGYNREEDAWDYNSTRSLVFHLLDKVSRGGNFLLDIGPDEHGKIPPIMQERLLEIGEWLKINGEAIYGTTRWKTPNQWTAGKKDYKAKKGEDAMMKLTIDPEPGYATKDVFYTYNAKENALFAIFPKYPAGRKLVLKNICCTENVKEISFLSTRQKLSFTREGKDLVINLPEYDPETIRAPYAYVVKISNYGSFTAKPKIVVDYNAGLADATVTIMQKDPSSRTVYWLDNGGVTKFASYTGPFTVKGNVAIMAVSTHDGDLQSDTARLTIKAPVGLLKAVKTTAKEKGLRYKYYENDEMNMTKLTGMPVKEGIAEKISVTPKQRTQRFGLNFEGYIRADITGMYSFFTESDDGSILLIDGKEVVNNDGPHGLEEAEGKCLLEKGLHKIQIMYFDSGGDNGLSVRFKAPGGVKTELSPTVLFH